VTPIVLSREKLSQKHRGSPRRRVYFDHNATTAVPPEVAQSAIRFSLGGSNTEEEIDYRRGSVAQDRPAPARHIAFVPEKKENLIHRGARRERRGNIGVKKG
jgi:selenocysteine lyase/cysteine desulfurase